MTMKRKKRSARPPTLKPIIPEDSKTQFDEEFYLQVVKRRDVARLHDFIYGKQRCEIDTLIRGIEIGGEQAKTLEEKRTYALLGKLTLQLWREALNEKNERLETRLKKKTGKSFADVVREAKQGKDRSLFTLIEFNKAWLFEPFVQARITRAEAEEDDKFFYHLGEAVKRMAGRLDDLRGKQDEKQRNLRKLIRKLHMVGFDFSQPEAAERIASLLTWLRDADREHPGVKRAESEWPDSEAPVIARTLRRMGRVNS